MTGTSCDPPPQITVNTRRCFPSQTNKHKTGCRTKDIRVLKDPRTLALIFCFPVWTREIPHPLINLERQDPSWTPKGKLSISLCVSFLSQASFRNKTNKRTGQHVCSTPRYPAKALPFFKKKKKDPNNEDWDDKEAVLEPSRCGLSPLQLPQLDLDLHKVSNLQTIEVKRGAKNHLLSLWVDFNAGTSH